MSLSAMTMNSLENDDSFVILGSSPPPSMNAGGTSMSIIPEVTPQNSISITPAVINGGVSPNNSLVNGAVGGRHESVVQGHLSSSPKPVSMIDKTLASKIILGQIDPKSLSSSLFQQFPSLTGSGGIQIDDMMKISSMVDEHQQLKENLEKTNIAMRRQFTILQEWQDTVKRRMQEKNDAINKFKTDLTSSQHENDRLVKEVQDAKHKHDETSAQFNAYQISAKKEISEMTIALSEKDSIIQNIHAENERLQLEKDDFVVLQKNKPEPINTVDFIKKSEHEAICREMRHQLSDLAAKNLEFEDMKKIYHDELNCLKVNLTAAEELHREMRDQLQALNVQKDKIKKENEDLTEQLQKLQDESALLKVQVEVYQKDFVMEREAREKLVTEKDNILSELQLLKMRNKQLIDDAQERLKTDNENQASGTSKQEQPTTSSNPNGTSGSRKSSKSGSPESENQKIRYICPICNHELKTLRLLEQHIDICLKD